MIRRLAIVGVGLLGGSVAKAARAHGLGAEIVGIGRDAGRLQAARRDGALDHVTTDLAEGLRDADLVVLASPVGVIVTLLDEVAHAGGPETIVTDVGSTKAAIVRAAERLGRTRPLRFVGSHPMAGSEKTGPAAATAELFHDAVCVVTPTARSNPKAVAGAGRFGSRPSFQAVSLNAGTSPAAPFFSGTSCSKPNLSARIQPTWAPASFQAWRISSDGLVLASLSEASADLLSTAATWAW